MLCSTSSRTVAFRSRASARASVVVRAHNNAGAAAAAAAAALLLQVCPGIVCSVLGCAPCPACHCLLAYPVMVFSKKGCNALLL